MISIEIIEDMKNSNLKKREIYCCFLIVSRNEESGTVNEKSAFRKFASGNSGFFPFTND